MFFPFRNRAKKNSFTTLNLTFLLLKTMFDSISRILLFSTWLYVINNGQFSSTKTVIAYYSTFTLLFIVNTIFNKQKDYTSARTWIGSQHIYLKHVKCFVFRNILQLNKLCALIQQLRFWANICQKTIQHKRTATRVNILQTSFLLHSIHCFEPWVYTKP